MSISSFLSKLIPDQTPKIPDHPDFNVIEGEYIYDSKDFEVIAYAGHGDEIHYLMKHKKTGIFFSYYYHVNDRFSKHNRLYERSREYMMHEYCYYKTEYKGRPNIQFFKTYEEAFDIQLKPFGEEVTVKKEGLLDKPVVNNNQGDTDFLEIG